MINARFAKPLDGSVLEEVLSLNHPVVTVEDHTLYGGFGAAVLELAQQLKLSTMQIQTLGLPRERFISQGSRQGQLAEVGLDAAGLAKTIARSFTEDLPRAEQENHWRAPVGQ